MFARPSLDHVARSGEQGDLWISVIETGRILWRQGAHQGAITALAWSGDGTLLASGGLDGWVYVWQTMTGEQIDRFVHREMICRLCWRDGNVLVSTSQSYIRFWHVGEAAPLPLMGMAA